MIQRRPLKAPLAPYSSPSTASPGRNRPRWVRIATSAVRSASETGVRSDLCSTARSTARKRRIVARSAASAASRATPRSVAIDIGRCSHTRTGLRLAVVIHDDNPFSVPASERDPVRRFRGRLVAPVTIVTAGAGDRRMGLTVSSLMIADGEPGRLLFLCGHNADLGDVIAATGGFVVHVLTAGDEALSDRFAGVRPSPGGLFIGLEVVDGPRGPVLPAVATRAECALTTSSDTGWYLLI